MKVIVGVLALIAIVNAASIQWTGYAGNNQWTTNNNWYPNTVPGPNDDVTIAKGIVEVTIPTGVNSLVMGTDVDNAANLTLYHAFAVGSAGLTVHGNGNLILQSGLEPVTGPVYIDGTFTYNVGVASGPWSISSKGTAYLKGNGQKVFYGAQFVAQGSIYIDGIIALNASSTFLVKGNAQIDTGLQVLLADKNPGSVFDTTAGSLSLNAGLLSLQAPCNIGTLNIAAGANVNAYSGVVFSQPLSVPSGSVVATFGDANVTFSGAVTGAGSLAAGGRLTSINACNISTLTVNGGNTYFLATSGAAAGQLNIAGGTANFGGVLQGASCSITAGIIQGSNGGSVSCAAASLSTKGLSLGATLQITSSMSVDGQSLVSFAQGVGSIVVASSATVNVGSPLTLTGPSGTPGVSNSGSWTVGASLSLNNIDFKGTGSLTVSGSVTTQSNTLVASTVTVSGSGSVKGQSTNLNLSAVKDAAGSKVQAVLGSYSIVCPKECDNVSTGNTFPPQSYSLTIPSSVSGRARLV